MKLKDYEILYDLQTGEYDGRGVGGIRTVTVRAGKSLEVMCHPIIKITPEARREGRKRKTSAAMMKINARNQQRHVFRLIEANFPVGCAVVSGTYHYPTNGDYGMCDLNELFDRYEADKLPLGPERVRADIRNWIYRLRRRVVKVGGDPAREFKWLVRIEEGKEPPAFGLPPKYHFHAVISGPGLDLETVKAFWEEKHGFCRADPLRLKDDGAAQLSQYMTKQQRGGRWISHSRNLIIPQPRISDRKISRRRMAKIAADVQHSGREILEALYPGYRVVELPDVRYSDFVAGCYIYARMRRRD